MVAELDYNDELALCTTRSREFAYRANLEQMSVMAAVGNSHDKEWSSERGVRERVMPIFAPPTACFHASTMPLMEPVSPCAGTCAGTAQDRVPRGLPEFWQDCVDDVFFKVPSLDDVHPLMDKPGREPRGPEFWQDSVNEALSNKVRSLDDVHSLMNKPGLQVSSPELSPTREPFSSTPVTCVNSPESLKTNLDNDRQAKEEAEQKKEYEERWADILGNHDIDIGPNGRISFLARWINYLCCEDFPDWIPVTRETFFQRFRDGILLGRIIHKLSPRATFEEDFFPRPGSIRKLCLANIYTSMRYMRLLGLKVSNMCECMDFWSSWHPQAVVAKKRVVRCLTEIFVNLQMNIRGVLARFNELIPQMQNLLIKMRRKLSDEAIELSPDALQVAFESGDRVMALLIITGCARPEDGLRLKDSKDGAVIDEEIMLHNGKAITKLLTKHGCPVLLAPTEWRNPPLPRPYTLIFQLYVLWEFLTKGNPALAALPRVVRMNAPKTEAMKLFTKLIDKHFNSPAEAFEWAAKNKSDRLWQKTFQVSIKQLGYDGDVSYLWEILRPDSCRGYANRNDWLQVWDLQRAEVVNLGTKRKSRLPVKPRSEKNKWVSGNVPNLGKKPISELTSTLVCADWAQQQATVRTWMIEENGTQENGVGMTLQISTTCDGASTAPLSMYIDVTAIRSSEQLTAGPTESDPGQPLHFAIGIERDAEIITGSSKYRSVQAHVDTAFLFHQGRDRAKVLRFVAAQSLESAMKASCFFEELKLLVGTLREKAKVVSL